MDAAREITEAFGTPRFAQVYLAFRNGLRADSTLRDEYAQLKQRVSETTADDREAYTKAKFGWVLATVDRLDREAG